MNYLKKKYSSEKEITFINEIETRISQEGFFNSSMEQVESEMFWFPKAVYAENILGWSRNEIYYAFFTVMDVPEVYVKNDLSVDEGIFGDPNEPCVCNWSCWPLDVTCDDGDECSTENDCGWFGTEDCEGTCASYDGNQPK